MLATGGMRGEACCSGHSVGCRAVGRAGGGVGKACLAALRLHVVAATSTHSHYDPCKLLHVCAWVRSVLYACGPAARPHL